MKEFNRYGIFRDFPPSTRLFYTDIIWRMMLNVQAFRAGYFNILLSESTMAYDWIRFERAIPMLVALLEEDDEANGY